MSFWCFFSLPYFLAFHPALFSSYAFTSESGFVMVRGKRAASHAHSASSHWRSLVFFVRLSLSLPPSPSSAHDAEGLFASPPPLSISPPPPHRILPCRSSCVDWCRAPVLCVRLFARRYCVDCVEQMFAYSVSVCVCVCVLAVLSAWHADSWRVGECGFGPDDLCCACAGACAPCAHY